jgi:hypothetical protein
MAVLLCSHERSEYIKERLAFYTKLFASEDGPSKKKKKAQHVGYHSCWTYELPALPIALPLGWWFLVDGFVGWLGLWQ